MVVDRQKVQNQFRVHNLPKDSQNQGQGRQDDQADGKVGQRQAWVKTGKTIKKRISRGVWEKHAG